MLPEGIEDDWEYAEIRPRDLAGRPEDRAECCADRVRFVAEIPRVRKQAGKNLELQAARFRLCSHHTQLLVASDPHVTIIALKESSE